jgi:hypothetical protein
MLLFRTRKELASFLQMSNDALDGLLSEPPREECYSTHYVRKRSGGLREIRVPKKDLKDAQRKLRSYLEGRTSPSTMPFAHGFHRHRSIVTNALQHSAKRLVLVIDITDFFSSITQEQIYKRLIERPFHARHEVADAIAKLACDDGVLPQGSPLSPLLANLVCGDMDRDIAGLVGDEVAYTRYADDLAFSTHREAFPLSLMEKAGPRPGEVAISGGVQEILRANGFELNHAKTRLQIRGQRQVVTGLVVNEKPNVQRRHVRKIRSSLHALERYYRRALLNEKQQLEKDRLNLQIEGGLAFLTQVSGPANARVIGLTRRWLLANELEYDVATAHTTWARRFAFDVVYLEVNDRPANGFVMHGPERKFWSLADAHDEVILRRGDRFDQLAIEKLGVTIAPRRPTSAFHGEELLAVYAVANGTISIASGIAGVRPFSDAVPSGALVIDVRGTPLGLYQAELGAIESHANFFSIGYTNWLISASARDVL